MLETAGLPLPGETILLLSGVAASTGRIDPWIAIAVGSAAAIIGDNIGYAIGRYGGRRLVMRLAHIGRIEKSLAWGEQFFARHGGKTVFLARWIFGLRIFGAWIAGHGAHAVARLLPLERGGRHHVVRLGDRPRLLLRALAARDREGARRRRRDRGRGRGRRRPRCSGGASSAARCTASHGQTSGIRRPRGRLRRAR